MILIDVNLLIYAYNTAAAQHVPARAWTAKAFAETEPVAIPWAVVHAFLRLTTDGRFVIDPFDAATASSIVDSWFALSHVRVVEPGPRYWSILRALLVSGDVRGKLVSDAHLAALALEHDATLYTADRDFRRFEGLRVINPLA